MTLIKYGAAIAIIGGIAVAVWQTRTPNPAQQVQSLALAEVTLPASLSDNAKIGKVGFEANCASCHGLNGAGQDGIAPPLIHKIYEPSHHGDEAFQRAAAFGVQAHHWRFGNMPPVAGLSRADVAMIVDYIREVQRANGIN